MLYFICGEDSYRSKKKLEEIILGYKKVHKSGLNLMYIDAKETSFDDFYSNFKITSMFAEKKLIILNNVFASVKFQEALLEQIKNIHKIDDIVVIYEDNSPDKRTKLFKALQKDATCQSCDFLQPAMLKKWVAVEFANIKTTIRPEALDLLVSSVGVDLWRLSNEIQKLSNYKQGTAIEKDDVTLLVRPAIENDIFKTIDAIGAKNKKLALLLLQKHLENGDAPLYLLSMIIYQFRNILIIKDLIEAKAPYGAIAKKSGLHPFVVQKTFSVANQFSLSQLKAIYKKIFQIDGDIKLGKIEPELALNLLISEI